MSQELALKDVFGMLDRCAPGYTKKLGKKSHRWQIWYKTAFFDLPKGGHKKGKYVEVGHVKRLLRRFEIWDCGTEFLGIS